MRTRRYRLVIVAIVILSLAWAALAGAGCTRSVARDTPTVGRAPQSIDLNGLVVTLEATAVPPPGESWLQEGVRTPPPQASKGNRLMWVRLTVRNSTDTTIAARVAHNFPSLRDSTGQTVGFLLPFGARGSPEELPPHQTAVAVAVFDAPPGSRSYSLTWTLSNDRVAVIRFAWP